MTHTRMTLNIMTVVIITLTSPAAANYSGRLTDQHNAPVPGATVRAAVFVQPRWG